MSLVALLFTGCDSSDSSFKIKGSFRDMKAGNLYIYNKVSGTERFDTITIKDGEFIYGGMVQEPAPYILVFPNGVEQVIFVDGGEELRYEAAANDLRNYVVNGSELNKLMNRFRKDTFKSNSMETQKIAGEYIMQNPASPVAVYLFERYFVQQYRNADKTFASMLDTLKLAQPKNRYLMKLESDVKYLQRGETGKRIPELKLKNRKKEEVNLHKMNTDWTLLVFWATWMKDSYDYLERVKKECDRYDDKQLSTIFISLDTEIYKWEDFTRNDTVRINHCCDGRAWESSAVKQLGVGTLPCYMLIDKKHNIVARGETASLMVDELKKHIK